MFKSYSLALFVIVITSCREDISDYHNPGRLKGVFILNEGNYGTGNGDISLYNPDTGTISNNLFNNANQSPAGDVVQDMLIYDTLGIIVVNNSNKIRIVHIETFKLLKDLSVDQPRYIVQTDSQRAFISCYGGYIKIMNLTSLTITDSIDIDDAYPESMIKYGSKTYVAKSGWGYNNRIGVISNSGNSVIKNITVGYCPLTMSVDYERGRLYVACSGRSWDNPKVPGGIYVINLITDQVSDSFITMEYDFRLDTLYTTRIVIAGNLGYFINGYSGPVYIFNTVYREMVDKISGNLYNVAIDADRERIYATTCESAGHFKVYDFRYNELESHEVGAFPGTMVFHLEE